jgi:hypothetical protein
MRWTKHTIYIVEGAVRKLKGLYSIYIYKARGREREGKRGEGERNEGEGREIERGGER